MSSDKKIRTWNKELVDRLIDLHSVQLMKNSGDHGLRQGLRALKTTFHESDVTQDDVFNQVDYLAKCFVYLKYSLLDPATQSSEYEQILDVFNGLLSEFSISSHYSSPLQFLHIWSQYFRSKILMREGEFSKALFHLSANKLIAKSVDDNLTHCLNIAAVACQVRLYNYSDFSATRPLLLNPADILLRSQLQIFLLQNQFLYPGEVVEHVKSLDSIHPLMLRDYNWNYLITQKFNQKNIADFAKEVLSEREYRMPKYHLHLKLFLSALGRQDILERVPKLDTIRRFDSDAVKNGSELNILFDFLNKLDGSADQSLNKADQHEKLYSILSVPEKFESQIFEIWGYASILSTAHALKIKFGTEAFSRKYGEACLKYSRGQFSDLLGILNGEEPLKIGVLFAPSETTNSVSSIKDGISDRFGALTKMLAEVAVDRIKGSTKKIFAPNSKKHQIDTETLEKNAEILVKALGELKGPYMKLGQLISTIVFNLPEGVETEMSKILDSTIPLEGSVVRQIVEEELSAPIEDLFDEWRDHPIASASIGQIHRARLKTGEEVVVKVQFPEIERIVQNDAKTTFIIKPIYKMIFPSADIDEILKETNKKLLEECDYTMEMQYQNLARSIMDDFQDVYVPKVYESFTTKKIIVMEYVEGLKFHEFKRIASDIEVNRACTIIVRFLVGSYFKHGLVNGDPHPGNFIFMPDGRVCVIDYGFSDIVPLERRIKWIKVMEACYEQNLDEFSRLISDLGMVSDSQKFDFNASIKRSRNLIFVGLDSSVKLDAQWVRSAIQAVTVRSINRKYIMLNNYEVVASRFFLCMYSIILKMEPEISLGRIYKDLVDEMLSLYSQEEGLPKEA